MSDENKEDLEVVEARRNESTVPFDDFVKSLEERGLL